jgi:chromodomain-helicase-DNA-binding protein 7
MRTLTDRLQAVEAKFIPSLEDVIEKPDHLINRVVFHYQLGQVLTHVQGPLSEWPQVKPAGDAATDYALMLGVRKNGIGPLQRVLEGINFEPRRRLTDKLLWKTVSTIVKEFAPAVQRITKIRKDFLEPMEWREAHEELFNRSELTVDEFITLFQTVSLLGFPVAQNGEIDWVRIAEFARLTDVSLPILKREGHLLFQLANRELEDESAVFTRLGPYGSRLCTTRLRTNVGDIDRIRAFVRDFGDQEPQEHKRAKRWETAPDWWDATFDMALLRALSDFGLLVTLVWLTDPDRPFAEHIPSDLRDEFERLAQVERVKWRAQKPKDMGEFSFLFSEKNRMARALAVLNSVPARPLRSRRGIMAEPEPSATDLPQLPLEIGTTLVIRDFGAFTSASAAYPIGFVAHREYFSVENPTERCWYEASTEETQDGTLGFRITNLNNPGIVYTCHTSSGCWEKLIADLQEARKRMGLPCRKCNAISGPCMYGFSSSAVNSAFRIMARE